MNGRCETDPFDQATDVCDMCYGEFCRDCLVKAKGRKHRICKECAIVASGVRAGARVVTKGSKKTAKQRRETLKSKPIETSFQYFDVEVPADEPQTEDSPVGQGADPDSDVDETSRSPGGQSAIDQLDFIRNVDGDGSADDRGLETTAEGPAGGGSGPTGDGGHGGRAEIVGNPFDRPEAEEQPEVAEFRAPRPFIRGEIASEKAEAFKPRPFIRDDGQPADQGPQTQDGTEPVDAPAWTRRRPTRRPDGRSPTTAAQQPAADRPVNGAEGPAGHDAGDEAGDQAGAAAEPASTESGLPRRRRNGGQPVSG